MPPEQGWSQAQAFHIVVVGEPLEQLLMAQGDLGGAAERWAIQWQGPLNLPEVSDVAAIDCRLAHLLAKHVR